jgi:hypothetical protein
MRLRSGWDGVLGVLLSCGWLSLAGCQSPGSQRIIGPDGSAMAHVHCGGDQGLCFRLAGELCPSGYDMKPVLSGDDGNFLVRCRAHGTPVASTACLTPSATASSSVAITHPPGLMDPWPPSAEPASAAYPWPASGTGGAARSKPSASGDVDIGY